MGLFNFFRFNKKSKSSSKGTEKTTSRNIVFGQSTRILKFTKSQKLNFKNHIIFKKAVIAAKHHPKLEIIALIRGDDYASYEYLLVETGSTDEFLREMHYETTDNIFNEVLPDMDFEDIWADGTVMDTAPKNTQLASLDGFNELKREITKGYYQVSEWLSTENQSENLDNLEQEIRDMEANCKSDFLDKFPNGFECPVCKVIHHIDSLRDASFSESDSSYSVFYKCWTLHIVSQENYYMNP